MCKYCLTVNPQLTALCGGELDSAIRRIIVEKSPMVIYSQKKLQTRYVQCTEAVLWASYIQTSTG